jgi:hypothetical protein
MMSTPLYRFGIASLLTCLDAIVLAHYGTPVWLVWGHTALARGVMVSTLALWTASAMVLWLHVYYDVRRAVTRRRAEIPQPVRVSSFAPEEGD